METSLIIPIYYYNGIFYLPTCMRSLDGMVCMSEPIVVVAAENRAVLAEEIELKAIAGNPLLTRTEFRAHSDLKLLAAMRVPNRQVFFTDTKRWSITETNGHYSLIPFKPAKFRGVVEDMEHAISLDAAIFVQEAIGHINAQLGGIGR